MLLTMDFLEVDIPTEARGGVLCVGSGGRRAHCCLEDKQRTPLSGFRQCECRCHSYVPTTKNYNLTGAEILLRPSNKDSRS